MLMIIVNIQVNDLSKVIKFILQFKISLSPLLLLNM